MKDSLLTSALTLLIILENGLTLVPAPFNVTVTCHNFETIVYWKYSEVSQFPLFKVELIKDVFNEESEMKNTTLPYVNISSSIRILERYYVKVTAVNGSEKSETAESPTFSFDNSVPVSILCFLDFPDVNLSVKGGLMTVTFTHPFHVYRNTPALEQLSPSKVFRYKVLLNGAMSETLCECAEIQRDCSITIPVPEKKLHCVNLTGTLRNTVVRTSKEICQQEEPQSGMPYFAIPLALALAASVGIMCLVIVFVKKTTSTSSRLKFLFSSLHPQQTMMPQVLDMQISSTPLLQVLKDTSLEEIPTVIALLQGGSCFRIGQEACTGLHMEERGSGQGPAQPTSLREPCRDQPSGRELENKKQGEDSGDSQLCVIGSSGYDRPQILLEVELFPADLVEGYRHTRQTGLC
ncbi:hypothetical protein MATL_G00020680 [Megalops atlanticus]|uniref:Fibronectin type-III domain-containing protein n=1 Tax=Megalops atlanticus TaxID=7932 RepID=A0A9D3TI91_MEGAT|nr:hypothetical protein MATL_G00020680 [Megalops atlanticus]